MTRKEWASKDALIAEVADVPENWLRGFAIRHPLDCRKFAAKRNGSMMYRVAAVLAAIEDRRSNGRFRLRASKNKRISKELRASRFQFFFCAPSPSLGEGA